MPCYDGRSSPNNSIKVDQLKGDISDRDDEIRSLKAGLCATISELEKRGIADEVLSQASKSGLINLMDFWLNHKKDDITRLSHTLHQFSEHEQEMMRTLLNKRVGK
jgi:hypothetical protein